MSGILREGLRWAPRVLGIATTLFLAAFALDAFTGDAPTWTAWTAALLHLMPALVVGVIVAWAWTKPAFGAVAFAVLAIGYAVIASDHRDWIVVISGPLALTALLFGASAMTRSRPIA